MTYLADNHQDNLKKVLRTALVGIRPADQVLLKGYLRILLRLEADLEWVSASHGQIDLFLISHEFRDAASVMKLLSSQMHKPVLYVSRTEENDTGYMADNHVILPLKKLDTLSEWLMRSVPLLQKGSGTVTNILQQHAYVPEDDSNIPTTMQAAQSADNSAATERTDAKVSHTRAAEPIPTRPANTLDAHAPQTPATPSPQPAKQAQESKPFERAVGDYEGIVRCIKALQQRLTGLQQITALRDNERVCVAVIEPSTGRLWQDSTTPIALSLSWQIEAYNDVRPHDSDATDMTQWLWQAAWRQSALLAPLINDDASYRLRYWVKPALDAQGRAMSAKERREMMRVMTAIEHAPRNVSQMANRADISVGSSKKIIASLLFSGSLQTDNYLDINTRIQRTATASVPTTDHAPSIEQAPPASAPTRPVQMTMDELLARRARGEHTPAPTSSSITLPETDNTSTPKEDTVPDTPKPAKSSFLSKWRQKLGL
ncbi:hypothetical protein [Psychrobacter aestuarii]|uniref:Uncharacterized protein n=1 Tax=Psychrobacter aestuarii TaxID=556327 RepID=A0ABN0VLF9_9GAMM|nr:hypothetical protein [Psychrobacter aestuarii]